MISDLEKRIQFEVF